MKLLFKNVMVKELPEGEEVTSTGIFLGNAKVNYRKPVMAEVVAVGDEVNENIQIGKFAMYLPGTGDVVDCEDYKLRILEDKNIILVADKGETIEA